MRAAAARAVAARTVAMAAVAMAAVAMVAASEGGVAKVAARAVVAMVETTRRR